jgi:hypothetical protein
MIVVELMTAVSLFASLYVVNWLPWLLVQPRNQPAHLVLDRTAGLQITSATVLILVPALLMGMVMPLVLEWAAGDPDAAVARVGRRMQSTLSARSRERFFTGFVVDSEDEYEVRADTRVGALCRRRGCRLPAG